ncbi:MAG: single-stranded-DNA-specific exonuclease RecJ [Eubacterium sp.]
MKHKSKKWMLQTKRADFQKISDEFGISKVLARCIVNREVSEDEIDDYIHADWRQLHSPWLFKDMEKAVQILRENREKIVAVSSDFDCDGIFSAIILKKGLEKIGIHSRIYTPDRVAEGYGVNRRIIDEATESGAEILLTCDNGIAANNEIRYAKEKGMLVIVTDHHEVQEELPPADAIVDPKQSDCRYPFKGLCGAGVAFQLIGALYEKEGISPAEREDLLEYVAIATVADVMELKKENRGLVKSGLLALEHTKNIGLRALLEVQELKGKQLEAYHIGFVIGPCFNAAGRIDTVTRAFELLEETNKEKALQMAKELKKINDIRKQKTEEAAKQAFTILKKSGKTDNPVHIVLLPDCHESLVGIVAGRIKEEYHHPVIVFCPVGDGLVKGSGRSIETYHMFDKLMECKDLMVRFGGHKMAAGMTLHEKDLPELERRLNADAGLTEEDFVPELWIDVAMPVQYITFPLIEDLQTLEPFGVGNPKPVFAEQHFHIIEALRVGKNRNVLTMKVANEKGYVIKAVYFGDIDAFEGFVIETWGEAELRKMYQGQSNEIDVGFAYYPSVNEYNGNRDLQIVVTDYCVIAKRK